MGYIYMGLKVRTMKSLCTIFFHCSAPLLLEGEYMKVFYDLHGEMLKTETYLVIWFPLDLSSMCSIKKCFNSRFRTWLEQFGLFVSYSCAGRILY